MGISFKFITKIWSTIWSIKFGKGWQIGVKYGKIWYKIHQKCLKIPYFTPFLKSRTLRQSELRSHTQFFYFCLKGIPAIIIPSLRSINKK